MVETIHTQKWCVPHLLYVDLDRTHKGTRFGSGFAYSGVQSLFLTHIKWSLKLFDFPLYRLNVWCRGEALSIYIGDWMKAPTMVLVPQVRDKILFLLSRAEGRKTIDFANGNSRRLCSICWPFWLLAGLTYAISHFQKFHYGWGSTEGLLWTLYLQKVQHCSTAN